MPEEPLIIDAEPIFTWHQQLANWWKTRSVKALQSGVENLGEFCPQCKTASLFRHVQSFVQADWYCETCHQFFDKNRRPLSRKKTQRNPKP